MLVTNNFNYATKCVFKSKTWFDIGKLIYSLSEGSDEGYKLWVMYSETDHENFEEFECYDIWTSLEWITSEEYFEPKDLPEGY